MQSAGRPAISATSGRSTLLRAFVLSVVFLLSLCGWVMVGRLRWVVPAWYVLTSGITFVVYWFDKADAQRGRWRTPESTLQGLALIGGWPGAWMAQQTLRHKSRKASFQVAFWACVALNLAVLAWAIWSGTDFLPMV